MSPLLRSPRSVRAARAVLADLRFRHLAGAIGTRVAASSLADLTAVAHSVAETLGTAVELEPRPIEPVLAKYDLAHLQARIVGQRPPVPLAGAAGLRALLGPAPETRDDVGEEDLVVLLEQIAEDARLDALRLVVFLDFVPREPRGVAWFRERRLATDDFRRLPDAYFPRSFEISDAYLTNAPAVSLLRRFYL